MLISLVTRVQVERHANKEQEHVALDGITLRGTRKHQAEDHKMMHLVSLDETETGIVLKEQERGEHTRVGEFLTQLDVTGRVVRVDA